MTSHFRTTSEDTCYIDRRISVLQAEIIRLRRRRNELQPVSRLPTEILADIFLRVQGHDVHPLCFDQKYVQKWSPILRVCYLWWRVALEAPELWTRFDLTIGPPVDDVALWSDWVARSGTLPLRVRAILEDYINIPWLRTATNRVRHLCISADVMDLQSDDAHFSFALSDLRGLQSLYIGTLYHYYCFVEGKIMIKAEPGAPAEQSLQLHVLFLEYCIPNALFLQSTPALQFLCLMNCILPAGFLAGLRQMSHLRVLCLMHCNLDDESEWSSTLLIDFPKLEGIYFYRSAASTFGKLWSLLRAPRLRIMAADVHNNRDSNFDSEFGAINAVIDGYLNAITEAGHIIRTLLASEIIITGGSICM
jgi:hypothetical protein